MIKINKQLQRPDKGTLSSGSIIDYNTKFIGESMTVIYMLTHWFNELARTEEGWLPVAGITNFSYRQTKVCTPEEWALLDDAGATALVQDWLKEIIDSKIGVGNTEIV